MNIQRVILSGGPGTGKTSILNSLKSLGFNCFDEISREIIKKEIAKGSDALPWQNLHAFSEQVISHRVIQYKNAAKGLNFYDRGIIDVIAYMNHDKFVNDSKWLELSKELNYHKVVFITPPWREIFKNDMERMESFQKLVSLHQSLISTYKAYGYAVIEIPKDTIENRVQFILKALDQA